MESTAFNVFLTYSNFEFCIFCVIFSVWSLSSLKHSTKQSARCGLSPASARTVSCSQLARTADYESADLGFACTDYPNTKNHVTRLRLCYMADFTAHFMSLCNYDALLVLNFNVLVFSKNVMRLNVLFESLVGRLNLYLGLSIAFDKISISSFENRLL